MFIDDGVADGETKAIAGCSARNPKSLIVILTGSKILNHRRHGRH
jgi:hypothetical protein